MLHELIGLIYETAEDPELWPMLLAGLSAAVEEAGQNPALPVMATAGAAQPGVPADGPTITQRSGNRPHAPTEAEWVEQLIPHFQRALRINRRLVENHHERSVSRGILEHLPLGVMLVDKSAKVRTLNHHAEAIVSRRMGLRISDERLTLDTLNDTRKLRALIQDVVQHPEQGTRILRVNGTSSLSLIVVPDSSEPDPLLPNPDCTVFIAAAGLDHQVCPDLLKALFGLTPAEARLTRLLVTGKSLENAANELCISRHTARTQLKSVFAKTGTNRQPELVQRILTSPAIIKPGPVKTPSPAKTQTIATPTGRDGQLRLRCGRRLHFAEYGDPEGQPVFFFHSIVGSRLQIHPDGEQTRSLGLRWIVPERPGFGDSDPQPNRSLLDWADDIQQLADHLKLDRYYLAGYSAGGAHAAACAWRHPQRVIRLALISSMAPFTSLSALSGMPPTNRMLMGMARYTPALLSPCMRVMIQGLRRKPEQITSRHIELWPEADRQTLARPGMREYMIRVFQQAIHQGPDAIVQEQILLARPWGFDPGEIETETHIWHGDADIHVPIGMLKPLTRIPRHTRHTIPDIGHYLLLAHWQKIFNTLVA
jgi:pimeloyl-ACP methyl ester carboxylesterase/DNA-binding CsgD family transcriptional regulator